MRLATIAFLLLVACRADNPRSSTTLAPAAPPARHVPRFADFPADSVYTGPHAPVDLTSPGAREFRTVLREGAKDSVNFAGHYVVVQWGCGSPCHSYGIVDAKTGRAYIVPVTAMSGAAYRTDSRLWVLEPPADVVDLCKEGWMRAICDSVESYYYVWEKDSLRLIDSVVVDSQSVARFWQ